MTKLGSNVTLDLRGTRELPEIQFPSAAKIDARSMQVSLDAGAIHLDGEGAHVILDAGIGEGRLDRVLGMLERSGLFNVASGFDVLKAQIEGVAPDPARAGKMRDALSAVWDKCAALTPLVEDKGFDKAENKGEVDGAHLRAGYYGGGKQLQIELPGKNGQTLRIVGNFDQGDSPDMIVGVAGPWKGVSYTSASVWRFTEGFRQTRGHLSDDGKLYTDCTLDELRARIAERFVPEKMSPRVREMLQVLVRVYPELADVIPRRAA